MTFKIVKIELYKIFKKWRTYIGFIAIGLLVMIVQTAMYFEGQNSIEYITRNLKQSFLLVGNLLNTYFVSYIILNALVVHVPFLIALVAGDLLAGEATAGTYRMLISRPVSRMQIVTGKFIAGLGYTTLLIFWLALVSLGFGFILFGTGELIVMKSGVIIIFDTGDILWRFLLAYGYAVLAMSVVCSLAYLFSSLVENAIGPIISTMAVIIIFLIVSTIDIDIFRSIKPFLFTNYILSWKEFFNDPPESYEIIKSGLILLLHTVIFFSATAIIFKRKDILS